MATGRYRADRFGVAVFRRHDRIVFADHGDTRGGRNADNFGVVKIVQKLFHQRQSFGLIAAVIVHLATTGLRLAELNGVAQPLQNRHDGLARLRKQCVVITGNEERNPQPSIYRKKVLRDYDFRIFSNVQWLVHWQGKCVV